LLQGAELDAFATPLSVLEAAERLQAFTKESVTQTRAALKEQHAKIGKVSKGPMFEAKLELTKLESRLGVLEKKVSAYMEAACNACQSIVDARFSTASACLREEVTRRTITPEELFAELAQGEDRIAHESLCKYLDTLDGLNLQPEQAQLLCRHIEVGAIGKRKFLSLLQQYFVVVRSIAITDAPEISKAKTIRKADADEVLEVVEGPRTDSKVGLTRVKGKSLIDGHVGWITVCGNQGTPFLQEMEKPYYSCKEEVVLQTEFSSDNTEDMRTLRQDEVLELVEGPRKEVFGKASRVRGKALSDGVTGWFTVKDSKGSAIAEPDGQYYSCTTSVAMTDEQDIRNCNVVRKLVEGEVFTVLEGPVQDKEAGITRVKGKATKDEQEGWITIKGNAGTIYAQASSKHYSVVEDVPLHKQFSSVGAEPIRILEKGEAVQAMEGPREESFPPQVRVKGKALSDGMMGWVTLKGDNLQPWSPYFTCVKATSMQDSPASETSAEVRQVEHGEAVELIEGPLREGEETRMKIRSEKDGCIGWVTQKSGRGTFFE